ncbi:phosphatase PAP2 family protein [Candidatus Absconditicoccus praedator]|uniref:phosphatase PAP2 family protein n=1 Tax=Candidatus Absconditicoccus praedator TaxID=2735562 RepID=UPI001E2A4E6A|nr:phosphatase PAP2 family protein [Candidatus Absconditicoccus praedator]UFX83484.1 phosphatase PAP2 family protein [Candidatus Absconditicoccus praedator]
MFLKLKEPEWGKLLLENLNDFADKNYFLSKYIPITADIFVFVYPIYLVYLYLYGVYNKNVNYKYASLYIFFSGVTSMIVSQAFQFLIIKDRPEDHIESQKNLVLEHLPDVSIPSDHMTLSMAIATSSMLWGLQNKNRFLLAFSFVLFIFSFIMGISRVMGGIHRPTDIIAGFFLGILCPLILIRPKIYGFFKKRVFDPLIILQKYIFEKLFGIKEY